MLHRVLLSLCGSLILFVSVLLWNRHALNAPCINNMDRAYTHLSVAMAERGEAYEGAFSHAGFRHPGPILFYYLAAGSEALGPFVTREDSFRIATTALNCLFVGIAIFLLSGLTPHGAYALLLAPLAFVIISPRLLFDYWNPHPIPTATCAYLLSVVYLSYGRVWQLPLMCALGSFMAQCHLSTPPFIAACGLYGCGACLWRRRTATSPQPGLALPLLSCAAIALVLWSGPLADLARFGEDSNLRVILRSFAEEHRTPPLSRTFSAVWFLAARKLNLFFHLPASISGALPLACIVIIALTTPRRGAFFHLRALVLIAWGVTVWALSRSFQPLADYLVTYFLGVLSLAAFLALMALVEHASLFLSRTARLDPKRCRLAVCSLALAALLFSAARFPEPVPPAKVRSCNLSRFAGRFVAALAPQPGQRFSISPTSFELRGFSVFFALEMLKTGADICFDNQWEHYVGRALTCSFRESSSPSGAQGQILVELSRLSDREQPPNGGELAKPQRRSGVAMEWRDLSGQQRAFEAVGRSARGGLATP